MSLSSDLASQFAKITNDKTKKKNKAINGTVVLYGGKKYVRLDGSEQLTPVSATTDMEEGDRVTVEIEDHAATVTGNLSSPAARHDTVETLSGTIAHYGEVIANKVDTVELEAERARIDEVVADNVFVKEQLTAVTANIEDLTADNLTVKEKLTAAEASIKKLDTEKLSADIADIKFATIEKLEATNADVENLRADHGEFKELTADKFEAQDAVIGNLTADHGEFKDLTTKRFEAQDAVIGNLTADYGEFKDLVTDDLKANKAEIDNLYGDYGSFRLLVTDDLVAKQADIDKLFATTITTEEADIRYANIDFTNIGKAAMENFYANSGLIKDVIVGDQTITGHLVGVTISGDLVEAGTLVADKLVLKGDDGLYYKLNTDGETVEAKQTDYNSLNGKVILAKSLTAEKINVDDLVAFDATIAGINIRDNALYSGVKESATNTTRGFYLGKDGQVAFGDANNYLKYFKDTDNKFKLEISAGSIKFVANDKTVEEELESIREEVTTFLHIDSSRGLVFKNTQVSTVLSVIIYRGSKRITNMETLRAEMGDSVYLQWKFQRIDEDRFWEIDPSDPRIGNDGFTFTIRPDDIDRKATFACDLIES